MREEQFTVPYPLETCIHAFYDLRNTYWRDFGGVGKTTVTVEKKKPDYATFQISRRVNSRSSIEDVYLSGSLEKQSEHITLITYKVPTSLTPYWLIAMPFLWLCFCNAVGNATQSVFIACFASIAALLFMGYGLYRDELQMQQIEELFLLALQHPKQGEK